MSPEWLPSPRSQQCHEQRQTETPTSQQNDSQTVQPTTRRHSPITDDHPTLPPIPLQTHQEDTLLTRHQSHRLKCNQPSRSADKNEDLTPSSPHS